MRRVPGIIAHFSFIVSPFFPCKFSKFACSFQFISPLKRMEIHRYIDNVKVRRVVVGGGEGRWRKQWVKDERGSPEWAEKVGQAER